MTDDFETYAANAMGKAPSKRLKLEREIVRQLVAGRDDAARALYDDAKSRQLTFIKKNLPIEAARSKAFARRETPIVTSYDPKPIPTRAFDWHACRADYEPGKAQGFGVSEAAAIADLLESESLDDD